VRFRALDSFQYGIRFVAAGDEVDGDDGIVERVPTLFERIDAVVVPEDVPPVETARARPGTRRTTKRAATPPPQPSED